MTTPSGLLAWGQSGQYNAVDDRQVITALANTRNGMVTPAVLSAGAGLTVNIAGGWLAVANCGDSTSAVIGSRTTLSVNVPAGPGTGTLTSYIWADVNPDAAQYTISVITPAQASGRSGVQLGIVVANAGNNLASQMTLTAIAASFGNFDGLIIATAATGGTAYLTATKSGMLYVQSRVPPAASGTIVTSLQDGQHRGAGSTGVITAQYTLPQADLVPWSHYKMWTAGQGKMPTPVANFWFDIAISGGGSARITFASTVMPAGTTFSWWAEGHVQCDAGGASTFISLKVDITTSAGNTFTGIATTPNAAMPNGNPYLVIRTGLQIAGGTADSWGSVFQRFGGVDPTGQVVP